MASKRTAVSNSDTGAYHRSRWDDYVQSRNTVHEEWFNNSSALYGDPFATWDDNFHRYQDMLRGYREDYALFNINKIRTIMAARDAFITGENATVYVHSTSDETAGQERARVAQNVARAFWLQNDMWSRYLDAREYCKWTGNGYLRVYFNPWKGAKIKGSKVGVGQGLVLPQVLSPYQVTWDPLADEWDKINHLYIASIIAVEDAKTRYPGLDMKEAVKDSQKYAWVSQHERYIECQKPELARSRELRDERNQPRNILRLEYFEMPTREYPQGRYQVIVGDQIVKETPLEVGVIPVVPFFDMKKSGTLIAQTPMSDMATIQEAIIRLATLLFKRAQIPDIIGVPSGWPTEPRKFAGKAFIIGELQGFGAQNQQPVIAQSGQIRQDHLMLFRLYEEQLENIAGVSSIASRQKPGYQMSGRMGYIVTDANRAMLGKISYGFKKSCEQVMRLVLMYINRYYSDERMSNFINENDKWEVINYRGTDIGTDYTLDVSLGLNMMDDPTTIAQTTLQFLSLPMVQQSVISNPVAFKKATEAINPELAQRIFNAEQDSSVAERENIQISRGDTPEVMPWHNDDIHLRGHKQALDGDDYLSWSPIAQQYLQWHYRKHEEQKQAKFNQMAMQMAMMGAGSGMGKGQPGQKPTGGSPGMAPPKTGQQGVDTALERATVNEFPGAPKPGG